MSANPTPIPATTAPQILPTLCADRQLADALQLATQRVESASGGDVNAQAEAEAYLDAVRARSKVKMFGALDNPQSGSE